MGHANQRPQQIDRVEVFPYVAALDAALHQRVDRPLNPSAGSFIHSGWPADERVERRGDESVPRREVAVQGPCANVCPPGDVVQAGVCAEPGKSPLRDFQDALTIASGVGARFSSGGTRRFRGHRKKKCNRRQSPIIQAFGDILRFMG